MVSIPGVIPFIKTLPLVGAKRSLINFISVVFPLPLGPKRPIIFPFSKDRLTFYELEKEGLIKTEKTIGRRVTTNQSLILKEKRKLAKAKTKQYVQDMVGLGISEEELIKYLKEEI